MNEEFDIYNYMTVPELRNELLKNLKLALEDFDWCSKTEVLVQELEHYMTHIEVIYEKLSEKVIC